jgi:hypothetical protein
VSWGAQNRSKDAKIPSAGREMSDKPELDCCPVQPYLKALPLLLKAEVSPVPIAI